MSQSKVEFAQTRIIELLDTVIAREGLKSKPDSYADLGWVKFYVKDLTSKCKGCEESHNDTPTGSKKDE